MDRTGERRGSDQQHTEVGWGWRWAGVEGVEQTENKQVSKNSRQTTTQTRAVLGAGPGACGNYKPIYARLSISTALAVRVFFPAPRRARQAGRQGQGCCCCLASWQISLLSAEAPRGHLPPTLPADITTPVIRWRGGEGGELLE